GSAAAADEIHPRRAQPWPDRVLELAETIPVLEGGRVKPLSTYASFLLLRIHGKRTLVVPDASAEDGKRSLSPTEWLLDCLFFPDQVGAYLLLRVEDRDAMRAAGVPTAEKQRRDLWSSDVLFGR